jgi:UDP-3-O-[3-hydroxymyristoyl] glucosamine N-acyltransferase
MEPRACSLAELAAHIGARVVGDPDLVVRDIGTLQAAKPGDITFLSNPRYRSLLESTRASAVILSEADVALCPADALVVGEPYLGYAKVAELIYPAQEVEGGVHPSAVVSETASIDPSAWIGPLAVVEDDAQVGPEAWIGPGCLVGRGVWIGAATTLVANVTLCHGSVLGKRVIVHPGAVIGSDGFGLARDGERWAKIPQLGRVLIGDDVEIGANTTVDRGAIGDTIIEDGVKLDNLIQIAHNVRIGMHTAAAACVGISGSTTIGRGCTLAGGVGVAGHVELADNVHITGMSTVTKTIKEAGVYSGGTPLDTNRRWHKNAVRFKQLDDMARRLGELERRFNSLAEKS